MCLTEDRRPEFPPNVFKEWKYVGPDTNGTVAFDQEKEFVWVSDLHGCAWTSVYTQYSRTHKILYSWLISSSSFSSSSSLSSSCRCGGGSRRRCVCVCVCFFMIVCVCLLIVVLTSQLIFAIHSLIVVALFVLTSTFQTHSINQCELHVALPPIQNNTQHTVVFELEQRTKVAGTRRIPSPFHRPLSLSYRRASSLTHI